MSNSAISKTLKPNVINNEIVSRVLSTKFLGILIDNKLSWHEHINYISLKISRSLHVMNSIKYLIPKQALLSLYYSLIYPHLNYCTIVWGSAGKSALNGPSPLNGLKLMQKRAVRIISKNQRLAHTEPIFNNLRLLKLEDIYNFSCLTFMYKFKNNLLPFACNDLVTPRLSEQNFYNMRIEQEFTIPKHRTTVRERVIKIRGPKLWNKLPSEIKNLSSIYNYKKCLKQYIFQNYH